MRAEIDWMTNVLLGRRPSPLDRGVLTLMEVAEAFHARASEMCIQIQRGEAEGTVPKGERVYHFRTGELRTFMELCSKAIDLGSRRVTALQLEIEMRP